MTLPANFEGKFEILHKISEGGMGAVYKVRHVLLDEIRVIKVIRPQHEDDENLKLRFHEEARTATRMRHPNIAVMYDFSVGEGGSAYIVMEFIDGKTLHEILAADGPPSLDLTLEICRQSLDALSYLHHQGYVHRDISPDNLMLTRNFDGAPLVKLIDLGIAKRMSGGPDLTSTGMFMGKARYSSPEQFSGKEPDHRSDVYSFGVMLYQLLTGTSPIQGEDFSTLVAGHLFHPPMDFDETDPEGRVPTGLRMAVMKALEKEPEERYSSAKELSSVLETFRHPLPAAAGINDETVLLDGLEGVDPEAPTKAKRPRWLVPAAAGVLALALGVGGWWASRPGGGAPKEIPVAEQSYLSALALIEAGDPSGAPRLLRQARDADPAEKASLDWVTPDQDGPYLPHFALGLAYFELKNCVGALDAWQESERQGVVQTTPQYAKLRQARGECDALYAQAVERLEKVLGASTEVAELLEGASSDPAFESVWRRSPELSVEVRQALDAFAEVRSKLEAARSEGRLDAVLVLEPDVLAAEEALNELADLVMESTAPSS
ncbi:MAG: serine/threonine protein kinase [bacterium]|nr:serine/threonine protein kinase [bacterium]